VSDLTYETIAEVLVDAIPEFRPALEQHLRDQEGEVLPHLLFGDLTRFVLAARDGGDDALVERCLAFLDLAARSPRPRVTNLVAASFVENVGPWEPQMSAFIETWPDALRRMAVQQGWDGAADEGVPGPPDVDVYARVEHRDLATIEEFLGQYMTNWREDAAWYDTEPVAEAIARACAEPASSFARYGRSTTPSINSVIMAFGRDGSTVLGLSVHGESNPLVDSQARALLDELMQRFDASEGTAVWEEPPPLDRDEWSGLDRLGARVLAHRRAS
jgi:hypothetical protein